MAKHARVRPISEKRFWELIDWSATRSGSRQRLAALRRELIALTPEEIVGFDLRLGLVLDAANRRDLWGAATVVNASSSDEAFLSFRCWLVSRGQRVYREALRDPDNIISAVRRGQDHEMKDLLEVAREAWKLRTRRPESEFDELSEGMDRGFHDSPAGQEWNFRDEGELRRRFPRLMERFVPAENEEDH